MASRSFGPQQARRPHLVTPGKGGVAGEVADLREDVEDAFLALEDEANPGVAASLELIQAGQPSDTDTLDVGADTYQFLTTPAGATSDIEVEIGASAEETLDNLLAAAVASGTENLYWDKLSATKLRLRSADAPQGTITGADPDIAIDASGATNWSSGVGDVNMNTLAGVAAGAATGVAAELAVTASMITAGQARISFPFTPRVIMFSAWTSAGIQRLTQNDAAVISGDDVVVTLAGGVAPDVQATDLLRVVAYA